MSEINGCWISCDECENIYCSKRQGNNSKKAYICGKFPSLNEYIAACRSNRYAGAAMKKEAEELVMWQLTRLPKIDKPVHITFTWYEMNRKRDKDNVAFAKKFVLDALQKVGVLPNDNNRYIAGFTDLFVYGHGVGVEIEIEEVGNERAEN